VLANIDRPDIERKFLDDEINKFVSTTRRWALALGRWLQFLTVAWFVALLPMALILGMQDYSADLQVALAVTALVYLLVLPFVLLYWYRRAVRRAVERLRHRELPDLIAILRFLMARGPMDAVLKALESLQNEMAYSEDDPRATLVAQAIEAVHEAIEIPLYVTEEEMLENLSDPLVSSQIVPEELSVDAVEKLQRKVQDPGGDDAALKALDILHSLCLSSPELREQLRTLFQTLASDPNHIYSRRRRKRAVEICLALGIGLRLGGPWPIRILARIVGLIARLWGRH
jgi:hypothetical protein